MSTPMRRLGRTGLSVSELGYGAWGIGKSMWIGADDETSLGALREAIEHGVRFIDTAMAYGNGHSEELVGAAVRASGEEVVIATKIPPENQSWPASPGDEVGDMYPGSWIVECTERSLSSLGLGTVDVQQLHTWTDDWVGKGDWAQAVATLKEQGKIRFFGVSIRNFDPGSVLELIRSGLVDTVQVIYNVFEQGPAHAPGQPALVERHPDDDPDVVLAGGGEELLRRRLLEDVVDHLHGVDETALDELEHRARVEVPD